MILINNYNSNNNLHARFMPVLVGNVRIFALALIFLNKVVFKNFMKRLTMVISQQLSESL